MVTHMASVKVHMCVKRTRSKTTGYKSKTAIVRLRFMFHYQIPHELTPALASSGPHKADGRRRRTPAKTRPFVFNTLTPQQPRVTPAATANRAFSP